MVKRYGTDRHKEKEKGGLQKWKKTKSDREKVIQKGPLKISRKPKISHLKKAHTNNKLNQPQQTTTALHSFPKITLETRAGTKVSEINFTG